MEGALDMTKCSARAFQVATFESNPVSQKCKQNARCRYLDYSTKRSSIVSPLITFKFQVFTLEIHYNSPNYCKWMKQQLRDSSFSALQICFWVRVDRTKRWGVNALETTWVQRHLSACSITNFNLRTNRSSDRHGLKRCLIELFKSYRSV